MKTKLFLLIFIFTNFSYANDDKKVASTIKHVNVFLSQAEITRNAKTSINAGYTDIVLNSLSQNIDPNSIQVTGKGDVVIMSVSHKINYMNKALKSDKIKTLEIEKNRLTDENVVVKYKKDALQEEKNMIIANKSIGGANSGVNWEQLENIADFYRERLVDISQKWVLLDKSEKENNSKYNDVVNQINNLTSTLNKPSSDIIVKIYSKGTQNISLDFNYIVYNAGWTPLYDFRAKDGDKNIDVTMKANVYQNTGVSWNNIPITLSTGNPSLGATKSELNPWFIHLQAINQKYKKESLAYQNVPTRNIEQLKSTAVSNSISMDVGSSGDEIEDMATVSTFVSTNMKQLSTEYYIELNQTIASDNKKHMVTIKEFKVDAVFDHAAVPKLDKDAFLMANIIDWQKYDWMSSEMNVFYDGTYIGRTLLDVAQIEDTLSLSLGRDKKVIISREKIKDFCSTKSFGLNKKKFIGYEITVRNNKKTEVTLNLQDQIPLSQNEQVEVKIIEITGAKKNEDKGFLDWETKLNPGEVKKYEIKFEIKYPKRYHLVGI